MDEDVIPGLEMPSGTTLIYEVDADLKPTPRELFVAAHGNSIRAIIKYFEDSPSDVIPGLEIPIGTPSVYELDADLRPIPNESSSRLMAIPSVPS